MRYRKFYIQPDKKDIQTYEYLASDESCYEDDIEVIETAALTECQKKLEKACELLRESKRLLRGSSIAGTSKCIEEIDTFLSQIKEEK